MKSAWTNLVTGLGDANADIDVLLDNFLDSVETVGENLLPSIKRILTSLLTTIEQRGPDMLVEGVLLLGKLAVGLITGIPDLIRKIPEIIKKIVSAFTERSSEFKGIGKNIVQGIWDGIVSLATWIKNKVSNFFSGIVDGVKGVLGIHSPSRVFAGIGENMALGLGEGWEDEFGSIKKGIKNGLDFGVSKIDFSDSGIGKSQSNAYSFNAPANQDIVINLTSAIDGTTLARAQYRYNAREANLRGNSLVEVYG
jgi:phage-related protein